MGVSDAGSALLPFLFLGEGSPTELDYRKKGTLTRTALLEDLDIIGGTSMGVSDAAACFFLSCTLITVSEVSSIFSRE